MKTTQGPLLYEGKAKRIFSTEQEDKVIIDFKDDATAFNALKRSELKGKGRLNCQISACIFEFLQQNSVPTHFLGLQGDTLMIAQRVEIIPLEVVVRNIAAGSLCKQTPIIQGQILTPPLLDIYYKDDGLGDPLLTEDRIKLLQITTPEQQMKIKEIAMMVNDLLKEFFDKIDLLLVDFKIEIGVNNSAQLLLADEISPDTCRLWDKKNTDPDKRILDKDRFRKDLGEVVESYGEILKRIQGGPYKFKTAVNLSLS